MRKTLLLIWLVCAAVWVAAPPARAGLAPINLLCDDWQNPMGIDDLNPRLSWQVVPTNSSERAQSETAWQIQVASSAALLGSNQPDLWDTGQVMSPQPFNVPYAGTPLASAQQVFWQVRIWDQSNSVSAWSPVATWTMGLLNPGDWQGGWLTGPTNNTGVAGQTGMPIFRRQFNVGPGLQRALIYICGLGQYELTANGAKVGSALLAPGWSLYPQTCLYDTLDLTSSLTNGNNAVGVMLGNGMYNVPATANYTKFTGSFGQPKLIAQIYLFYTNGTSQVIPTDAQWLTTSGPITYSHVYGGEDYDAQSVQAGWDQAGFAAASWVSAAVTNGPGGTLRGESHAAPPIIVTQILQPVLTNVLASGAIVYDLGQNATIIPTLTTHGPAGSVVQITPAELTNPDGSVNRNSVGGGTAYWQYTLAGTGSESWMPKFFYHGCRYLQVVLTAAPGQTQLPSVDALAGRVIQSSSTNTGNFACSFQLFNRIRTLIQWAQRNNLISSITDCPHRERLGWLEEDNLNGPSLRYEFDLGRLFAKTEQDMADSQTSVGTGLVPDIAPEVTVFSGGFRDSPEWGSSAILVPWQQYLFTGDDSLLQNYYSAMTNYFAYLNNQAVNYFLNYPNGLGDWFDIGPNGPGYSQDTPISLTADAYYCMDAQILGKMAALLGKTADAARFNSLSTNIGNAFNSTYYSATNGYYSNGSQTAQALPLYLGLVNATNQALVLAELVANINSKGLTSGEIGHRYLLRALTDMGRPDVVYNLHSGTNDPGYGYILNQGATALTEGWDADTNGSQDHFMLGHITEWFYHDLAGMQYDPALPGFQHVIIKPAFVGNIAWVNASYHSVRGTIASNWLLTNDTATLSVSIPVGSTGSIYLPLLGSVATNLMVQESGTIIWQNGALAGSSPGVTFNQVLGAGSQTYQVWTVGSGNYQFVWNLLETPGGLAASAGNGEVKLTWNATPGATGYNLERSLTNGSGYVPLAGGVGSTNYNDLAVSNGTTYYYVVSAVYGADQSAYSTQVSATPGWTAISGIISNFGFEVPITTADVYNPAGGSWTFTAQSGSNSSGISANGSAFTGGNPNAPQGNQVAFLQGTGSISQSLSGLIAGAVYQISFSAAQRNNIDGQQPGQTWQLKLDGTPVGTYAPPETAQNYATYSATFTVPSGGSHILTFVGTDTNGGDNTVFLDNVQLALAPSLAQTNLTCRVIGAQIQLLWPASHAGWVLQMQTNPPNAGLGTNWVAVTGSSFTNQFTLPLVPASGSTFFRLAYP